MEKAQGPPPGLAAPPYPGPPMDPGMVTYHPQPAQPVYQHSPQQPQVIQQVSHVVMVQPPTDAPGQMTCPHCHNTGITKVQPKSGLLTWLICGGLTIVGCWLCCWIPFCVDDCKDMEHTCPICNQVLHVHKRI